MTRCDSSCFSTISSYGSETTDGKDARMAEKPLMEKKAAKGEESPKNSEHSFKRLISSDDKS